MRFFNPDFLEFFKELAANNNREWFDENRKRYEQEVKQPFRQFVACLIARFSEFNSSFSEVEPHACIFRINRDIRFSKDKSPYKLMSSAVISVGGKKGKELDGVYIELTPEHLRVYGGLYEIEKEDLLYLREGIASSLNEFRSLISDPEFKEMYGFIRGEKNKVLPKELRAAGQMEELLFNKQFYYYTEFSPETILESNLDQRIVDCYKVARPLELYFTKWING